LLGVCKVHGCNKVFIIPANQSVLKSARRSRDRVLKLLSKRAREVLPDVVVKAVELVDGVIRQVAALDAAIVDAVGRTSLREVPARQR